MSKRPPEVIAVAGTDRVLADVSDEAVGLFGSLMGLMFKASIPDRYGLVFRPAMGVHTLFMRFPIDLIYFDKQNRVKKIRQAMKPWRLDFTAAAGVVEMNPESAARVGLQVGDQLEFLPDA